MDRTGKIGIALSIIVLVVWQIFYSKQMEQARLVQEQAAQVAALNAPVPSGEGKASSPAQPAASVVATTPAAVPQASPVDVATPKVQEKFKTSEVEWTFSNLGGGVERAELLNHKTEGTRNVFVNEFGGIPIGALTEAFDVAVLEPFAMTVAPDRSSVTFSRTDSRQFTVEKQFTLPQADKKGAARFQLELEIRFKNNSAVPLTVPAYAIRAGSASPLHINDQPLYTGFNRSSAGSTKYTDVHWFDGGGFLGFGKTARPSYAESGQVQWVGVTSQYYSTILTPVGESAAEALARRFVVPVAEWEGSGRMGAGTVPFSIDGGLRFSASVLEPGKELVRKLSVFAGPREYDLLKELGVGQEQMLDFGMFGFVSKILLSAMLWLHNILGSYAGAIIVLTLVIKGLMWPLQNKSTASMKKMQALQPKMNALKEKYGDDPQRMNQELMGLYKKHGVNPMAGCLPMFVQIPIFFGFYNMLGKAVELRNSPFLWVNDLSQPDTVASLAGYPVNVLPLIMAVTMFVQMQLSPKTGDPMQQRLFMFMPLIFVMFCYNQASGLALYWTVQNIFTIGQLLITNRGQRQGLQAS
ncbi:MAG: membrane protein insertase YidC [Verrucomicrobiota bacterium]